METIKRTLFTGWNFMRWLRLVIGISFLTQGIVSSEALIGFAGAFFLLTAVTNTGCCGSGACVTPIKRNSTNEPEKITFEEIK